MTTRAVALPRPQTVSEILERRAEGGRAPQGLTATVSVLAHAGFLAMLLLVGRPRKAPVFVPMSLPVRVVSPASLGRPQAAPAPVAAPAEPASVKARPVIEKPSEKVTPSAKALPEPKKPAKPEKEKPAVAKTVGGPALELPSAGAANGATSGAGVSFGASVTSFDADFPFAYYVEQLLSLIGANWFKPESAEGTSCVVSFRILRSGQVTDVKVDSTSGVSYYDRAAARAVYAANPVPPLPPDYRNDSLGVHLKFQ
ncbi:MAG: TonB family protein [Acidobacteriota bacterium]|nr:TonB family protein [Acidobacteriota bacterium]